MEKLQQLYGIGPKMAKKIMRYGIAGHKIDPNKSIRKQLKKKDIFDKLPAATRADLTYNPSRKIPRAVIVSMDRELKKLLKGIKFDIAGSYRRCKPFSRDVDIIMSTPSNRTKEQHWQRFKTKLGKSSKIIIYPAYAMGQEKASVMAKIKHDKKSYVVKTDVFFADPKEYMYMLLYATGSGSFNVRMRVQAKRLGYLLNQYGLYKRVSPDILERVPIKTEKELFRKLQMRWLAPKWRKY